MNILLALVLAGAAAPQPLELHPAATERVLLNPGMGLYAQCGGPAPPTLSANPWWLPVIDIGYFRFDWSDMQPHGPDDDPWTCCAPFFEQWVNKLGKRVAIRVMSENMHSRYEYVTPKWVFDSGVPGVDHVGLYAKHQVDPIFWDDRYLDRAVAFIARMGKALDGRPGLEFVDIGQIGEWGEMHLGQHIPGRWTPEQLDATGYTHERYVAAYRRLIDAFAEAFPHTRVFLNVGAEGEINDYAALRHENFRQDGLNPGGPSANVGELYYKPYSERGVLGNYEFFSDYREMQSKGWDLAKTLEVGLSVPLSYLNTNLYGVGGLQGAPPEVRQLLTAAARRIGYRFGVEKVSTVGPFRLTGTRPTRLPLILTWVNRGVAWCPESYAVELALLPMGGGPAVARSLLYPDPPTDRWSPGTKVTTGGALHIPGDIAPGTWRLAVRMIQPQRPGRPVQLDLEPLPGAEGWHDLGALTGVAAPDEAAVVFHDDFEGPPQAWQAMPGIKMAVEEGGRQGGSPGGHALHVSGVQNGAWNVIGVRTAAQAGVRYRLTAWLKVAKWEARQGAPYFKAGFNRADGRWISNFETGLYDLKQLGVWQRVAMACDAPMDAANVDVALEKGGQEAVSCDLWVDDVSLECLEGP
jgi:hypothetical protein